MQLVYVLLNFSTELKKNLSEDQITTAIEELRNNYINIHYSTFF